MSVIVPSFNRAHLLPRCLDSILAQTFDDFEVIVADDGSTDDTEEVVKRYIGRDERVRYIWQENKGAGDARNLGASIATGRYFTFLDSDDQAHSEWLERLGQCIENKGAAIVCCGCELVDENGVVQYTKLPRSPSTQANQILRGGYFFTGTFAVHRDPFNKVGGYAPGLPANQHSELRMRLLPLCSRRGWKIECVKAPLVRRYSHSGPHIRGDIQAVFESACYIMERHGDRLRENAQSYAHWATACGGAAAKLGRYRESRSWFCKAIAAAPGRGKNYLRLIVAASPLVRSMVWRRASRFRK